MVVYLVACTTFNVVSRVAISFAGNEPAKKGLDEVQFTAKFGAIISREGGFSTPEVFAELDVDQDGYISRVEMAGVTQFLGSDEV